MAPYNIFSDLTLIELAEKRPETRWDMLKIRGIGNQKFKNYGDRVLKLINENVMVNYNYDKEKLEELRQELNINSSILEIDRAIKRILF